MVSTKKYSPRKIYAGASKTARAGLHHQWWRSIFRPAQAATASQAATLRMLASSTYFKVLINDDIIETNRPMTLEQGMSTMHSTEGGKFNNVEQSMTLLGQVKGRIERAPRGNQ